MVWILIRHSSSILAEAQCLSSSVSPSLDSNFGDFAQTYVACRFELVAERRAIETAASPSNRLHCRLGRKSLLM